ncbi:MAG: transglutaminase-like domain-containing protein [Burkholderiales bacterium]
MSDDYPKRWQDIVNAPREQLNLAAAALVIAGDEYPQIDVAAYLQHLDELAATFRQRLRADIAPAEKLALLNHYFFEELGFAGNTDDYYDPRNSFLNDVIERKLGIPITLSLLFIEIGQRVGLPLTGVSFPGHFLVKCALRDGAVIVDTYAKGASLGIKDLQKRLRVLSSGMDVAPESVMRLLKTARPVDILARLLRNLRAIYTERGDRLRALTAANRVLDLCPQSADDYRDRARLHEELECFRAALADFETYLRLEPKASDTRSVREKIAVLRERASRLN